MALAATVFPSSPPCVQREFLRNFRLNTAYIYRDQLLKRFRRNQPYIEIDLAHLYEYDSRLMKLLQVSSGRW